MTRFLFVILATLASACIAGCSNSPRSSELGNPLTSAVRQEINERLAAVEVTNREQVLRELGVSTVGEVYVKEIEILESRALQDAGAYELKVGFVEQVGDSARPVIARISIRRSGGQWEIRYFERV